MSDSAGHDLYLEENLGVAGLCQLATADVTFRRTLTADLQVMGVSVMRQAP